MKTINESKCTLVQFEPASCLQKFAKRPELHQMMIIRVGGEGITLND